MTPVELQARREALGLSQQRFADVIGVKQNTVSQWESGKRSIPAIDEALQALEDLVDGLAGSAADAVDAVMATRTESPPVLFAWPDDESFWLAHPEMDGTPSVLHRVAMARARTELDAEIDVVTPP